MDKQKFDSLFDLNDRVAIVTGGSRGIGRAIAEGYALAGAKVVVASRKAEACNEAVAAIEAAGGEALAVPTHMGELDQLKALADRTLDHFGAIDVLVNNAANALAQPFRDMTPEAWEKSLAVNLRGPVFLTQYCLPGLDASEHASVINVSSAGAFLYSAFSHMYAAAKAGLLAYVRANAAELAPAKIRVNGIAPGTVDTDMVRNNTPEVQEVMAKAALMGRAAHPDEMVGLALFLASDASSFITGATFNIDGGLVPR
ncbi:MAG: oxidoreductase [Deltaproteobacteria bacterium]|nr:oxidoreductase [Deltaproteobacteria bacterium]